MKKGFDISQRPWLLPALLGFLLGAAFGLFALGWGLFPVTWVDASPAELSSSFKEDYLRAAIDSYGRNQDVMTAQLRYQALAENGTNLLTLITSNPQKQRADDIAKFSAIAIGKTISPVPNQTPGSGGNPPTTASKSTLVVLLSGLCLLMLAIGGALIYILFIRNRTSRKKVEEAEPAQGYVFEQIDQSDISPTLSKKSEPASKSSYTEGTTSSDSPPVAQFMTSYTYGDDLYDDTFSIDAQAGEFLGECGSGISDTIGVGDPKKISAFEVWLFDKNDIQTVTKVLMSSHVYNDANARQRLAIRGEPVLAESGKIIRLETATLQLDVRIVDMNYGQGAMPGGSYFDRLSLELSIHQK
jgi:hypothetical protein